MKVNKDFEELFELLNKNKVKYLVVGGYAIKVINNGEVIANYPDDQPYPSKLFLGYVNKRPIHVVAGYDADEKTCILITVYQPDLDIWESDHKTKRK